MRIPLSEEDNVRQHLVLTKKIFHSRAGRAIKRNVTIKWEGPDPESTVDYNFIT